MSRAGIWIVSVLAMGCESTVEVCPTATPQRCGEACADFQTSRAHCGGCGLACGVGEACLDGACTAACQTGLTPVDSRCVNLDSDPDNCGAPGNVCAPGQVCSAGTCALSCGAGRELCGASCADLSTNPDHCGACGRGCDLADACWKGECTSPCLGLPTEDGRPVFDLALVADLSSGVSRAPYLIAEALREIGVVEIVQDWDVVMLVFSNIRDPGVQGFDAVNFQMLGPRPAISLGECGAWFDLTGWCNADYEAARDTYLTSLNPVTQRGALRTMQELFVEQSPASVIGFRGSLAGLPVDIEGYDGVYGPGEAFRWAGMSDVVIAIWGGDLFQEEIVNVGAPGFDWDDPSTWQTAWRLNLALNPLNNGHYESRKIHLLLFEALFALDADPGSPTRGQPTPQLATSMPVPVATGNGTEHVVTLDLRPSAFSDGHAVDAYDVAFTLRFWRFFGWPLDVDVVDEDTVQVRTPTLRLDYAYDLSAIEILPMHYWVPHGDSAEAAQAYAALPELDEALMCEWFCDTGFEAGTETFGSGPYMAHPAGLVDRALGTLRLVRNPLSSTAVGDVQQITIRAFATREEVLQEMAAGARFVVENLEPEWLADFPGMKAWVDTGNDMEVIAYNHRNPALAERQVRVALDRALPRQRIFDLEWSDLGTPANTFVSPAMTSWYDPDFAPGGPLGPTYDVAAARALLRSAGYEALDPDAPTLQSPQAILCNVGETLDGWVEGGLVDQATADRILSGHARYLAGR